MPGMNRHLDKKVHRNGRALGVLMLLLTGTAQAEIYRWVDADGKVHFTDSPPINVEATEVRIETQRIAPPDDPANRYQQDMMKLVEQRDEDRAASAPSAGQPRRRGDPDECRQARADYYWLSQALATYVDADGNYRARYRTDPYQGDRTWLDEAERLEAMDGAKNRIVAHCDRPNDQQALDRVALEVQRGERCTIARAKMDAMLSKHSRAADDHIESQKQVIEQECGPPT